MLWLRGGSRLPSRLSSRNIWGSLQTAQGFYDVDKIDRLWTNKSIVTVSTDRGDEQACTRTAEPRSHREASLIDFGITPSEALKRFQAWQSQHWLAPSSLLKDPTTFTLQPTLLPFWLFEAAVEMRYSGDVRSIEGGNRADESQAAWQRTAWQAAPPHTYTWDQSHMQVYASYMYRRDLAHAAQISNALPHARPMHAALHDEQTMHDAHQSLPDGVVVQAPDVRQAIAWEFALRALRDHETERATSLLQAHVGPHTRVRDVQIQLRVLHRRTRLLYLPAYVLSYVFGVTLNAHGERRANEFTALVGGTAAASVAGERHWCPHKSQAAAAGSLGLLGAAATLTAIPFAMHDPSPQFLTVDLIVGMSLAAIAAGAASRLAPQLTRRRAEQRRAEQEAAEYERIVAGPSMGDVAVDEALAAAQCVAEWRRWEESEAWQWDEQRRRVWAERLWREQHRRRLQRVAWRARQAQEAARQQWEAQRESRRQKKYGSSWQGGMGGEYFTHTARGGRRSDWLGYYRLLGLDATESSSISVHQVKEAFRQAALKWHPDRLKGSDEQELARAHSRFQQVIEAYNVLKDPDLKRNYDRGA